MWSFKRIDPQETRSQSKLADFFESSKGGNAGDAESLVRESLQNALDAKSKNVDGAPVKARITIGKQTFAETGWMFEQFDDHVQAVRTETKREFPTEIPVDYAYILIEDFNTTGFDGTFDVNDDANKGSFVRFWWEEGTSEKLKGGGGSHGVGKVTLSEASRSRVFFAHSLREEDGDEVLFGYCRIGMHSVGGKKHREYARFGVTVPSGSTGADQLHPYSRFANKSTSDKYINDFRSCFALDRESPGASILIPNIDSESLNQEKLVMAVLGNFYLPIMKGLLSVEIIDVEAKSVDSLNSDTFVHYCETHCAEDPTFLSKIRVAQHLITEREFHHLSTEFNFSGSSRSISEESFAEDTLVRIRDEYHTGTPVKVRFNVWLHPAGADRENGFFHVVVQKRKNRADDPAFYDAFRGDVRIRDEKLGTSKANAILDVFGAHDEEKPNALSEFMKYCEDPGHRNWNAAINRRNEPLRYKRGETWQKGLVRNSVRDLIRILENDDERKLEDFADDIFFFVSHQTVEVPGTQEKEDGVEKPAPDDKNVVPPDPPIIPPSRPAVSISKLKDGVRLKATKNLRDAGLNYQSPPPIDLVICYEMLGRSKAMWRKFGKMEINLQDNATYTINDTDIEIQTIHQNRIVFVPKSAEFVLDVTGFDTNRQLYVNADTREITKLIPGEPNDDS